jgi:hypothetical protein
MKQIGNTCRLQSVESVILSVRGHKVILDADLAGLYGVSTKALNQAIKRNIRRFPADFVFSLTEEEKTEVVTICDHLSRLRFSPVLPYAFTEHGAIMAASVLSSPKAVEMSVFVVRAFVRMREALLTRVEMEKRLGQIESILLLHDNSLRDLYEKIRPLLLPSSETPPTEITGFRVRERRARYGTRGQRRPTTG